MCHLFHTKSLKIPKESESVNLRRTENTMATRKRTIEQITIYKVLYRKQNPKENPRVNSDAPEESVVPVPHSEIEATFFFRQNVTR